MATRPANAFDQMNWETEEVIDWLINVDYAYDQMCDYCDGFSTVADAEMVRDMVDMIFPEPIDGVDYNEVDWDTVANYVMSEEW